MKDGNTTAGTPDYMSPEQVMGRGIEPRSDVYAFGVLIYQMLTGALPFAGDNGSSRMRKRLWEDPRPLRAHLPDLHRDWDSATLKCLAREPAQRFRWASDVVRVFRPLSREGVGLSLHSNPSA